MGIWIPLYASPSPEYRKLIASVENNKCLADSFKGTVLTGPNSGPPNVRNAAEDGLYRAHFDVVAGTKQWTAFGYVTTAYMRRPLDQVLADINTWLSPGSAGYGDQVQGIWVDNVVTSFSDDAKRYYGAHAACGAHRAHRQRELGSAARAGRGTAVDGWMPRKRPPARACAAARACSRRPPPPGCARCHACRLRATRSSPPAGAIAQLIRSYGKLVALNPGATISDCAFLQSIVSGGWLALRRARVPRRLRLRLALAASVVRASLHGVRRTARHPRRS